MSRRRPHPGLVALALAFLPMGCANDALVYQTGLPGAGTAAEIALRSDRGGYLDVDVATAGKQLRFFLRADDPACREIASGAEALRYVNAGVLGRLERAGTVCEPVGILSLAEWRDRRPRRSGEPVPRSRASYEVIYRDEALALLRGRFGLAGELGWALGVDTVAVVERGPACDPLLETEYASLEFRSSGTKPLILLGPTRPCAVLGLARPL